MARRRPVGRRGLPVVTSEGCSYSGTWSWVKLVSVPKSPPMGLYATVPLQLYRQLHVKCCALLMFYWTEVHVVLRSGPYMNMYVCPYRCGTGPGLLDAGTGVASWVPGERPWSRTQFTSIRNLRSQAHLVTGRRRGLPVSRPPAASENMQLVTLVFALLVAT